MNNVMMKCAVAIHGTRGDVEPVLALSVELQRRGHDVHIALPPNYRAFAEQAGLNQVHDYGPDSEKQLRADAFARPDALTAARLSDWKTLGNPLTVLRRARAAATADWATMSHTLTAIAAGADVILTGTAYQEIAVNVADFYQLPMAELHYFPIRANTHVLPVSLPLRLVQPAWSAVEWFHWRLLKPAEDTQRHVLGMPKATTRAVRRIVERATVEIQAYDEVFFPGLDKQWRGNRPFVGSLTLQQPTATDTDVASWIAAGTPPIYWGFGSMPLHNPDETITMIAEICAELGHRALICSSAYKAATTTSSASSAIPAPADHVKIVPSVQHCSVFPACRAIVHHGGAGTTAAAVRAGVPILVLWVAAEQPIWGNQITKLGVGVSRRFTHATGEQVLADLRTILAPEYRNRARSVAALMTTPQDNVANAADLIEAAGKAGQLR